MTLALELAKRINALRYDGLPAEALHWAKIGILDTVGVTLDQLLAAESGK